MHTSRKFTSAVALILVLSLAFFSFPEVLPVNGAEVEIAIESDGSVVGTDKIQRNGDIYTFTDDINATLDVKKNSVVVDGQGFTVQEVIPSVYGVDVGYRDNVTIKNVQVVGFSYGVNLVNSVNCVISNCTVTECSVGIFFYSGGNNKLTGNTVTKCTTGISFTQGCSDNFLRNNIMENNTSNFDVSPVFYLYSYNYHVFDNDIDTSNLVDGKPIYYLVNETDKVVPSNAGCVVLVNCKNITVQNLNLSRNNQGILLAYTTDSTVTGNTLTNVYNGIHLSLSTNNVVTGNIVQNGFNGIVVSPNSTNNLVSKNVIETSQMYGIMVCWNSRNNRFYENCITNNTSGVYVWQAQDNEFSRSIISDNRQYGIFCQKSPCNNNTFSENTLACNDYGIYILAPSNIFLRNNITNNNYGIMFKAGDNLLRENRIDDNSLSLDALSAGNSDIDTSNTINGRIICYWVNQQNRIVPSDAGYVALVNCRKITVENLVLSKNVHSILLVNTNNSVITENTLSGNVEGIQLYKSSNNTVTQNVFVNNTNYGVSVRASSAENKVYSNSFKNGGIFVLSSSYNRVFENNATGSYGIILSGSTYNIVFDNNLTETIVGLTLRVSENNKLRNNFMRFNEWNFKVEGKPYANDVDSSNLVDGKPIYYLVNETDKVVPSDAGYVCLVYCENVTVQNCTLLDNQQGVLLAYTNNCTISDNYMSQNTLGIQLYQSSGITISRNSITYSWFGLELWGTSQNCQVLDNYFAFNDVGVYFASLGNSTLWGNCFENNTQQVTAHYYTVDAYQNVWDNGSVGNYWSNYDGTDADGDGIGDTAYVINAVNKDHYPLMKPADLAIIPEFSSWFVLLFFVVVVVFGTKIGRRLK